MVFETTDKVLVLWEVICLEFQNLKNRDNEFFFSSDKTNCSHLIINTVQLNGFVEMIQSFLETSGDLSWCPRKDELYDLFSN